MVSWLSFPEQFATPSPSILAQFASARVPFQAPSIFTRQFKPKHWTKRFPSSSPRSHSANVPNRCRGAPSLLGSWVTGEIISAKKNAASTFYVISINTANFDDTIYRNSQPSLRPPSRRGILNFLSGLLKAQLLRGFVGRKKYKLQNLQFRLGSGSQQFKSSIRPCSIP